MAPKSKGGWVCDNCGCKFPQPEDNSLLGFRCRVCYKTGELGWIKKRDDEKNNGFGCGVRSRREPTRSAW